jgi:RimJ/RimL family protein N-acetyltransferase
MMLKLPPKKVIYNDQIELRLMSPRDGSSIYQGVVASLPELRRFMDWAHHDTDLAKACSIYAQFEAKSLKEEEVSFAGFDSQTDEFLCCCCLIPGDRLNSRAYEIGYWVASHKTGRGIGLIVAKMLTSLAFRNYQADRVYVTCNPENQHSLKIIENCGFQLEGRLRNYFMQPTSEMLTNGYSSIRDALSFSLVPDELSSLAWYDEFNEKLSIFL